MGSYSLAVALIVLAAMMRTQVKKDRAFATVRPEEAPRDQVPPMRPAQSVAGPVASVGSVRQVVVCGGTARGGSSGR
jgi:type IV secretory pathway VirB2 component (pilin)